MYELAPSIIAADYNCLKEQFKIMQEEGISYLHLDIMDGEFVPSRCMDIPLIKSIRRNKELVFDAHIMTKHVERVTEYVIEAGVDIITIHYESKEEHLDIIKKIKSAGKKAGIVINPETSANEVEKEILKEIDVFQIMSVEPGVGGQKFIYESLEKIQEIKKIKDELKLDFDIEVDGDVNMDNLEQVLNAGANIIVSGTALFQGDLRKNIQMFQKKIKKYELEVEK